MTEEKWSVLTLFLPPSTDVPSKQTPVIAIVVCSVIYAPLANNGFLNLLNIDVLTGNIALALDVFALIKLRYSEPDLERPYRIPGGWLGIALMTIPLVAVICWSAYEEWVGDGGNDRWVLIAAFAFCLVAYIPGIFLRRYYERRGELGLPREWIEAEHGTDAS